GLFAGSDVRAVRDQLRPFLARCANRFDQAPPAFRKACLDELNAARSKGLLSPADGPPAGLPAFAASGDIDSGPAAVVELGHDLPPSCSNLARLLRQPTPGGEPVLVAAFAFFLRREVEKDEELARGLTFDGLRKLAGDLAGGLGEVERVL